MESDKLKSIFSLSLDSNDSNGLLTVYKELVRQNKIARTETTHYEEEFIKFLISKVALFEKVLTPVGVVYRHYHSPSHSSHNRFEFIIFKYQDDKYELRCGYAWGASFPDRNEKFKRDTIQTTMDKINLNQLWLCEFVKMLEDPFRDLHNILYGNIQ